MLCSWSMVCSVASYILPVPDYNEDLADDQYNMFTPQDAVKVQDEVEFENNDMQLVDGLFRCILHLTCS